MKVHEEGIRMRLTWESKNEQDVKSARELFERLTKQGWLAARKDGEYKRILEFKPEYGEVLFIPLAEGG